MKYSVRVEVFTQKNVTTLVGETETTQPKAIQSYKIVTTVASPNSNGLKPEEIKQQLRNMFKIESPIEEVLTVKDNVITGTQAVTDRQLVYTVTVPRQLADLR